MLNQLGPTQDPPPFHICTLMFGYIYMTSYHYYVRRSLWSIRQICMFENGFNNNLFVQPRGEVWDLVILYQQSTRNYAAPLSVTQHPFLSHSTIPTSAVQSATLSRQNVILSHLRLLLLPSRVLFCFPTESFLLPCKAVFFHPTYSVLVFFPPEYFCFPASAALLLYSPLLCFPANWYSSTL